QALSLHAGLFFFFFQAEDGIRDATVTGVQTCALPISLKSGAQLTMPSSLITRLTRSRLPNSARRVARMASPTCRAASLPASSSRSEERRVGKECRYRGAADHGEEKEQCRRSN